MMSSYLKLAIIGASYLQEPLVRKAKELGLQTICFAWADGAVCAPLVDKFYPISIVEKEQILEICQKEQINGICTIASDVAAPTVAYVAEKMGLTGNSYEASEKAYNKGVMRRNLKEGGVPCPWFQRVSDISELDNTTLKYPLIVKPVDRSGSLGVTKVYNHKELTAAVELAVTNSFTKAAMVEQFIEGREISVEFISYKGKHYPLAITDKVTTGAPNFVELEHHQPTTLPFDIQEKINNITIQALDSLGITNGASHTEYLITKDNEIYIVELGGRMGGDFIGSDLVQLSTGYDFVKGVIDVALGQFDEPVLSEHTHSGVYFLCKETERVKVVLDKASAYHEIVKAEQTDTELRNVTCSADRSGYFIYKSDRKFTI